MNPETKLSLEQLKAICKRHNITYKHHERITTGFSHEVHRLNDDLIVKIFNTYDENDRQRFKTELSVLASTLPIKKPRLIANSEANEDIDRDFIIMSFVEGKSLGSLWHTASDAQREALVNVICESLRIINKIDRSDLSLAEVGSWQSFLRKRGEILAAKLKSKNIIDDLTVEKVLKTLNTSINQFKNSELYPVYWDIHFDNFIVNDAYDLQAIIDLENVELTSLDYPLFVVQKQTEEPEKFLREEDEKYANTKDYEKLKSWYQKYYPEMFDFDNLGTRLKVYQLLDTLHLLVDWSHVTELHAKLDKLTS